MSTIKMAGASVNQEFLQSLTLQQWLEKVRTKIYTKYPAEIQLQMLTKLWELANPNGKEVKEVKEIKPKKKK